MSNIDKEKMVWYVILAIFLCSALIGILKPMNYSLSSEREAYFDARY